MKRIIYLLLTLTLFATTAESAVLVFNPSGSFTTRTDLATAATASDVAGKTVVVATPQTVTTAITWPSTRELRFEKGGYITFSGAGALTGLKEAFPVWFGADITGSADSSTGMSRSDLSANAVIIPSGTYKISSNVTFTKPVTMQPGAKLNIATGVTVAFNGGFFGDLSQKFNCTGTGKVTFDFVKTSVGYPEWWGANHSGDPDNATITGNAINACIVACLVTQLQAGDYYTNVRIKIQLPHRKLYGKGFAFNDTTNEVTRLLGLTSTYHIVQIGPDNQVASTNDTQQGNELKNIYVGFAVLADTATSPACVLVTSTLYAIIQDVKTNGGIYGFMFSGTVYTKVINCQAVTAVLGVGTESDRWYGFYIYGLHDPPIAAGGNASLYIQGCSAAYNVDRSGTVAPSTGFYLNGKFTDSFLTDVETVNTDVGIYIEGNRTTSTTGDWGNLDLHISHPVIDAFHQFGILIKNTNSDGSIEIISPYLGAAADGDNAVYIQGSLGAVNIIGGQWILGVASVITGLVVDNSNGVTITDTIIMEASDKGVILLGANNCVIKPRIKNFVRVLGGAGIEATSSTRNIIAPVIYGAAYHINGGVGDPLPTRFVEVGVKLNSTANTYNEVNTTGISTISLSAPSKKLYINNVAITSTGLSGTNLVSGVIN